MIDNDPELKRKLAKTNERWQAIKQHVQGGPLHKETRCFACGDVKDCKAIFLCDDCIRILMLLTKDPSFWQHIVLKKGIKHI